MFSSSLADVTVSAGKPLILKCLVTGTPTPAILWLRDGAVVGASPQCVTSYNHGVARLELLSPCVADQGRYQCVARNSVSEVTCSCQVKVNDVRGELMTS